MESVGKTMSQMNRSQQFNYEELVAQILAEPEIANFIQKEALSEAEIRRSISKFNQYISERNRFVLVDEDYIARGYKPVLVMNEGYADVSYEETPELIEAQKQAAINKRLQLINLPSTLKEASLAKVDLDDRGRFGAFEELANFVASYPQARKGISLYGDFGVGKSYMMAALAHDLSEKRQASSTLLHFPSFVIDVKNAINTGQVKEMLDQVKKAEILILDDIGAEQMSPWVRDEVLQVILQHRMQEILPTFFTSNFNFEDLERHFATSRNGDETWQAKRVMERIKFLAKEVRLEGENRR